MILVTFLGLSDGQQLIKSTRYKKKNVDKSSWIPSSKRLSVGYELNIMILVTISQPVLMKLINEPIYLKSNEDKYTNFKLHSHKLKSQISLIGYTTPIGFSQSGFLT